MPQLDKNVTVTRPCTVYVCTVYVGGGMFGAYSKTECKELRAGVKRWAQYPSAVVVEYLEKGKRKPRGQVQSNHPTMVVLDGVGHPAPPPFLVDTGDGTGNQRSQYSSCDPRWDTDFDAFLAAYLAKSGAVVLLDVRGHNAHAEPAAAPEAVGQ